MASQQGVIAELEKQIPVQQEIAKYEEQVAALKFESNKLTARGAFEQKLTSQEIGFSKEQATRLSGAISDNVQITRNLKNEYGGVVMQIERAVDAQRRLNAARGSSGTTAFASGGYVAGPTPALVGEAGPEYIIPAGKMDEAMARYASGRRGSSVIPSSINPQVNVTTGPVMNMNGNNYVSQQDFMAGMQTASRRGAEMALEALQSNGSTRRLVGVG